MTDRCGHGVFSALPKKLTAPGDAVFERQKKSFSLVQRCSKFLFVLKHVLFSGVCFGEFVRSKTLFFGSLLS